MTGAGGAAHALVGGGPCGAHLAARLALIERRVRQAVALRRADNPELDDPLHGMYLSGESIDRLLAAGRVEQGTEFARDGVPQSSRLHGPGEGEQDADVDAGEAGVDQWDRSALALSAVEAEADTAELSGSRLALRALSRAFRLDDVDLDILLIALIPDLDARFERLFGYLNDDVTRRRATIGLALDLLCPRPFPAAARARFAAGSPLAESGLLVVEERDRPFLSRSLRVPDRVCAHLLGDETLDPAVGAVLRRPPPGGGRADPAGPLAAGLATALREGVRLAFLHEEPGAAAGGIARAALERAGLAALNLDLPALATAAAPESLTAVLGREAGLCGAGLVAARVDLLDPAQHPEHARLLRALAALPVPVVFTGRRSWDPRWADDSPLVLGVAALDIDGRAAVWREALGRQGPDGNGGGPLLGPVPRSASTRATWPAAGVEHGHGDPAPPQPPPPPANQAPGGARDLAPTGRPPGGPECEPGPARGPFDPSDPRGRGRATASADDDPVGLLARYVLAPDQIWRAAAAAQALALAQGGALSPRHLRAAVRGQNAAGLDRLARRIEPAVGWADLVLPGPVREQLEELASRAAHRDRVLGTWGMRPGGGRGRGVTALFAGDSGTGKTMSAEVIAGELGLDLYVVDLSTVVDKYVGETEKNLERVFTEAEGVNGVLLFDEADAIFGKRSDVKDAHDRYANTESAYLLQRMERFDGIALLTTNFRANVDEAFTRRLDAVVEFPLPDAAGRRALWDRCLGPAVPRGADLDLELCARFELTGGAIRSCAVTAAYRAAREARALTTADLVDAVRREYRKLGHLVLADEFGSPGPSAPLGVP
jgi:hypothetical protein